MPELRVSLQRLAEDFAEKILKALHSVPLSELASHGTESNGLRDRVGSGRTATSRKRARPAGALADTALVKVVEALKNNPAGMRNEQLQKALGLSKSDVVRALKSALDSKTVKRRGQRRATTYFAV